MTTTLPPDASATGPEAARDAALDALLAHAPPPAVPDDFADRVMAAQGAQHAPPTATRRPWGRLLIGGFAAAAAAALLILQPAWPRHEQVAGAARTALGAGAVLVTQAPSRADVNVPFRGPARIRLETGPARFITDGRALEVQAGAHTLHAANAAFTLEIPDMPTPQTLSGALKGALTKNTVGAALAGAALGVVVTLSVFDGAVTLDTADGASPRVANAGETFALAADGTVHPAAAACSPQRTAALTQQVATLDAQLKALMLHDAGQSGPLTKENARLATQLAAAERRLEHFDALQRETEGRPFAFPDDLPAAYQEDALRSVFTDKLAQSGLQGDITAVDCTEFPCIVYGDAAMRGENRESLDAAFRDLNEMIVGVYPRAQNDFNTSVWGDIDTLPDGTKVQKNAFGFAIYPKDSVSEDAKKDFTRRLRFRNQQFADTLGDH